MNLVLEVPTKLPSSLGSYSVHRVKMVSKDVPPVIELLDEEEEEWPDAGATKSRRGSTICQQDKQHF